MLHPQPKDLKDPPCPKTNQEPKLNRTLRRRDLIPPPQPHRSPSRVRLRGLELRVRPQGLRQLRAQGGRGICRGIWRGRGRLGEEEGPVQRHHPVERLPPDTIWIASGRF